MSEVRRDGYNYHNTYVESVEWQRDKAYARAEKLAAALREIADEGKRKIGVHRHCSHCFAIRRVATEALADGEKP